MKVALLIDGGHLRTQCKRAGKAYTADFVEQVAARCVAAPPEELFRVLYYDCAEYSGTQRLPVSQTPHVFSGSDDLLRALALKDLFAVRRGVLKFRGWEPRAVPLGQSPTDADFKPRFEQKGVDMRIGLDIAALAAKRVVDRIVLVTNDTDFVPALKHARREGLQIVLAQLPGPAVASELQTHADLRRGVPWP